MQVLLSVRRCAPWLVATTFAFCAITASADAPNWDTVRRSWFDAEAASTAVHPTTLLKAVDLVEPAIRDGAARDAELVDVVLRGSNGRLLSVIAPSDRDFFYFVSPQSNPLLFEDPRTLTEVRAHFVNQWIPNSNPAFGGGTAQYLAVQARIALTKRLSIIATKDGYLWLNPGTGPVANTEGSADIAAGLKYNLIRDPATQTIVSAGFTHAFPSGAGRVFQGNGNGEWNLFLTGGREFFGCSHWLSGTGLRLPDSGVQSSSWYWSNSFDVQLTRRFYGLFQVNWFHWFDSGTALAANFEGNDLFNLGSTNVKGNDIVTSSFGGRYKFGRYHEAGIAYEVPLTERKDLLQSRLYLDVILRY